MNRKLLCLVLGVLVLIPIHSAEARPGKWCGWWLRQELGVQDPRYNLARSWYKWGTPTQPTIGAVVVWSHHVGLIVGQNAKGQWLIRSGNDGGRVKTRVWNLKGAKFRI